MTQTPHFNILLVDDHAPNILAASTMIEQLGYSYLLASNGIDGLERYKDNTFDMVLMDLRMPEQSGTETAKGIRAVEKKSGRTRTPVIAMTAHIASSDMNECVDADMDDLIPKPLNPDYFSKMLGKYCKSTPVGA